MGTSTPISPLTPRGLERRVKRHFNNATPDFAAVTVPGFEDITAREIEQLQPGCITGRSRGIIEFTGPIELLFRVHLHCRTVSRFLMRITRFTVRSYPELFNKLRRINWEIYTGFNATVKLTVSCSESRLHHTDNIAETALSAINAALAPLSLSLQTDPASPLSIFLRFDNDECIVSIDASGELLYKRGMRTLIGRAPLRETTAAALLMAAGWDSFPVIADPFCGSGSIICEAVLLASGVAPGLKREFAFSGWPSFKAGIWNRVKESAQSAISPSPVTIFANDSDSEAIRLLEENLAALPASVHTKISNRDAFTFDWSDTCTKGLIISNLPYGKRITSDSGSMDDFYRKLGGWLKSNCRGWHFAFLVADPAFERKTGVNATTLLSFSNGGIKVRLVGGKIG